MIVLERSNVPERGHIYRTTGMILIPKGTYWAAETRPQRIKHNVVSFKEGWARFADIETALAFIEYFSEGTAVRLETEEEFSEMQELPWEDKWIVDNQIRQCEMLGLTERGKQILANFVLFEDSKVNSNLRYAQSDKGKIRKRRYDLKKKEDSDVFAVASKWLLRHPGKTFEDYMRQKES